MTHRSNRIIAALALAGAFLTWPASASAGPQGTAFTYQGRLMLSGSPVNQASDLQFSLFDADTAGTQIGSTVTQSSTTVTNGLFTVQLDFGAGAFDGNARWLEIAVRSPAGSGSYTTLSPRQPINAAPYSIYSADAAKLNAQPGSFYQNASNITAGTLADARLSANVALLNGNQTFTGSDTFSGGLSTTALQLTTSPQAGYVLTSDASGVGSWQAAGGLVLPYSATVSSPMDLWSLTNSGSGRAFYGKSTSGVAAFFTSDTGVALGASVASLTATNPAIGAATAGASSGAIICAVSNAANPSACIIASTIGTGAAGSFTQTNPGALATQDGLFAVTSAGTVLAAGVHAVGSGPGGPGSAAALNLDSGAVDVSGPIPTRAVQCVPVPAGPWVAIMSCVAGGPAHAHVEGYYIDVPFASPLIMVAGCNAALDTMIIPSIETLSLPPMPSRVSYYIQVHSRVPGGCAFRVTRMGDATGACPMPAEMNRINVLMVNSL